jgi:carotenoid cleavage dioxygenase-like enzyme
MSTGQDKTAITDLRVRGVLPASLSGRYLQIGDQGTVHAVSLEPGRAASYRTSSIAADFVAGDLVALGRSVFALANDTLAYELDDELDTIRPVDLAGARRRLSAHAATDPHTGELHLLTSAAAPPQLHVAVSRGALTRSIRSIDDPPGRICQVELTSDDVVIMTDGFVGVSPRAGVHTKFTWFELDTAGRRMAIAQAGREAVVAYATGPSLVRWTLDRRAATARCDVIDSTPHTSATINRHHARASQRFLWTVGSGVLHKHDLRTGRRRSHEFGAGCTPGQILFVAALNRSDTEDEGWLVGLVHDDTGGQAEFVVLDAEAIDRPAVATVHIPRPIPMGASASGIWVPSPAVQI